MIWRNACLHFVSVVMIAWAKASPALGESDRAAAARVIPSVTLAMGNWWPITPVEATSTWPGLTPVSAAVIAHILRALARPSLPVQALAQPELTTTA